MNVKEEYLRVYARIDLDALRKNMEQIGRASCRERV